jgi:predicted RNA-binding protein with PUA-like domain
MMRDEMKVGDKVLFYHSSAGDETGVVGEAEIVKEAYPDPTQFDPKSDHPDPKSKKDNPTWLCVDVKFEQKFRNPVYLKELKIDPAFSTMVVTQKGSRLSVTPVNKKHFDRIIKLGST